MEVDEHKRGEPTTRQDGRNPLPLVLVLPATHPKRPTQHRKMRKKTCVHEITISIACVLLQETPTTGWAQTAKAPKWTREQSLMAAYAHQPHQRALSASRVPCPDLLSSPLVCKCISRVYIEWEGGASKAMCARRACEAAFPCRACKAPVGLSCRACKASNGDCFAKLARHPGDCLAERVRPASWVKWLTKKNLQSHLHLG